jgi:hypothetical protein
LSIHKAFFIYDEVVFEFIKKFSNELYYIRKHISIKVEICKKIEKKAIFLGKVLDIG